MITVPLHAIAHARTGDKGNRLNVAVIAHHADVWEVLVEQVTEDRVASLFAHRRPTAVRRYLLPKLHALNLVIDDVLEGGVNTALNLDGHGKALSFLVLTLPVTVGKDALAAVRATLDARAHRP
ncbi:AtuA-related protein [Elioraea sp.]|uniref:AtuA-related protein n=1 Tax=Elioraea sp. TaxID=2185103 RepID=UPI003F6F2DCD